MPLEKYLMSFTTGGLFYTESLLLLDLYSHLKNWNEVYQHALDTNILQTRTISTAKRRLKEIINRLKTLMTDELDLLRNGSPSEQRHILWLSICKRYLFIREFATEVIRERYLTLKYDLPTEEFEIFYNAKAQWHEELDNIAESTRKKLRNVLFKMLKEAELIDANNLILPTILSKELVETAAKTDLHILEVFPISDIDLQRIVS